MKKNVMRFYNGETQQLHRFIPLFENIEQESEIMGICLDSCKRKHYTEYYGNNPIIQRGQMVKVKMLDRIIMNYKGQDVYTLVKVYNSPTEDSWNRTTKCYLDELWFDQYPVSKRFGVMNDKGWKSYEGGV